MSGKRAKAARRAAAAQRPPTGKRSGKGSPRGTPPGSAGKPSAPAGKPSPRAKKPSTPAAKLPPVASSGPAPPAAPSPAPRARHPASRAERRRAARAGHGRAEPAPAAALTAPLERADLPWAASAGVVSAGLFATVLTSHPALGDAPETVAAVATTGVLHPPGYPVYLFVTKLFTLLEPFGSLALRVNLFSAVCSLLTVIGVFALARRVGASRPGALIGALALALGASYWFYAGFAKHNAFSGLLFLLALHALLAWDERPSTRRLVLLAVALALGLSSSWPLTVLLFPAVGWVLWRRRAQLAVRGLLLASVGGMLLVVLAYGAIMVRAGQHPAVSWGEADTPSRLVALIRRADFGQPPAKAPGRQGRDYGGSRAQGGHSSAASHGSGPNIVTAMANDLAMLGLELGAAAFLLAAWGAFLSLRGPRGPPAIPLLLVFLVNLVVVAEVVPVTRALAVVAEVVGISRVRGYELTLIESGFLLGLFFVAAAWAGRGITDLVERGARFRPALRWPATAMLALAVVVPSLVLHWSVAHRASKDFAGGYSAAALAELPPRAVVFILGAERAQPLIYRQVVLGQRPDVTVIATDGVNNTAYRIELARRLGRPLPPRAQDGKANVVRLMAALRPTRPVFFDLDSATLLRGRVGYRPQGLLAQVTGTRGVRTASGAALEVRWNRALRAGGFPDARWGDWPNAFAGSLFADAGVEVGRAYFRQKDFAGLRRVTERLLRIDPTNEIGRQNLRALDARGL